MSPTIQECLDHARQCEWYAARTNDEEDRKFLPRKAKDWTKLVVKKERNSSLRADGCIVAVAPTGV